MNDTILIINDDSPEAHHCAKLVIQFGKKIGKKIVIASLGCVAVSQKNYQTARVVYYEIEEDNQNWEVAGFIEKLSLDSSFNDMNISLIDFHNHSHQDIIHYINFNNFFFIASGICDSGSTANAVFRPVLNLQATLNRIKCPLLLIPFSAVVESPQRLVYLSDLRYCQLNVLNYLSKLANLSGTSVLAAHVCLDGLPELSKEFANELFALEISNRIKNAGINFSQVSEKEMKRIFDVMCQTMRIGLIAFSNHSNHFRRILGDYIPEVLPNHINVPLLIFPA